MNYEVKDTENVIWASFLMMIDANDYVNKVHAQYNGRRFLTIEPVYNASSFTLNAPAIDSV